MTTILMSDFLTKSGEKVAECFTLNNGTTSVKITNYGGTIVDIITPDRDGKLDDVNLGFDNLEGYQNCSGFLGATVGRYANRIRGARFNLNGKEYPLYSNDGNNHLHGGKIGFNQKIWDYAVVDTNDGQALKLTTTSFDGEEGYPGNLIVTVLFTLSSGNGLGIEYTAVTDKDTVINLTNHSYFNLKGHNSGPICDHKIELNSRFYTKADEQCIPVGEIVSVEGTPMDLRKMSRIGDRIDETTYDDIRFAGGYDHNFIIDKKCTDKTLELAATVLEESSGRIMTVHTNKPAVQFYCANMLDNGTAGKKGAVYNRRGGLCLETQFFPDSPNILHFSNCILKAGEVYNYKTVYTFSVV